MMKVILFLIAVLGLANASVLIPERQKANSRNGPSEKLDDLHETDISDFTDVITTELPPPTLRNLVEEFLAFIPGDKLINIFLSYIGDPEVMDLWMFLRGQELYSMMVVLEHLKEMNDFLAWIYSHNIDVYTFVNTLLSYLNIPPFDIPTTPPQFRKPSVQSFLDMIAEMEKLLPEDEIVAWYYSRCENATEFQDLLGQLRSDSFQVVVDTIRKDPAFTIAHDLLFRFKVPIDDIIAWLNDYFGW